MKVGCTCCIRPSSGHISILLFLVFHTDCCTNQVSVQCQKKPRQQQAPSPDQPSQSSPAEQHCPSCTCQTSTSPIMRIRSSDLRSQPKPNSVSDTIATVINSTPRTRPRADRSDDGPLIKWVYEGRNGHWTLEHYSGDYEWHGWGPTGAPAPAMFFACRRVLKNPRDGLALTKACADVVAAVDRHRKKKGCGCELAWLGRRQEDSGRFFGDGVRDRPGKMLRCRWGYWGTGFGVRSAMEKHDKLYEGQCFGPFRAVPW